jgi:hypothetical protein
MAPLTEEVGLLGSLGSTGIELVDVKIAQTVTDMAHSIWLSLLAMAARDNEVAHIALWQ